MKRSNNVKVERFVKSRKFYNSSLLFTGLLASSLFLIGCDDNTEKHYLDRPYTDEYDCYKNSDLTLDKCKRLKSEADENAKNNGKQYNSAADCKKDNPDADCKNYTTSTNIVRYYPYYGWFGYNPSTGTGQQYLRSGSNFYTNTGRSFDAKVNTSPRTFTVSSAKPYSSSTISAVKAPTVSRGGFGGTANTLEAMIYGASFLDVKLS